MEYVGWISQRIHQNAHLAKVDAQEAYPPYTIMRQDSAFRLLISVNVGEQVRAEDKNAKPIRIQ